MIGIIALLIGLLMPALSKARQIAQRTSCAAKLNQQLLAAQIHLADHRGFYPLAGVLSVGWPQIPVPQPGGLEPQDLDDNDAIRYDYWSFSYASFSRMLAPINVALGSEMSFKNVLSMNTTESDAAEMDDNGLARQFTCPSQAGSASEIINPLTVYFYYPPTDGGIYIVWDYEPISYIYNECILGWGIQSAATNYQDVSGRLHGRSSQIRQTSKTMLVADGLGGDPNNITRLRYLGGIQMGTVYNKDYNRFTTPPITLADAYAGSGLSTDKAGDNENFDLHRHQGKINIGFCDGHVETRNITSGDLSSVYLMAP